MRRDLDPHQHSRVRVSDHCRGRALHDDLDVDRRELSDLGVASLAWPGSTILNDFSAANQQTGHWVHRHLPASQSPLSRTSSARCFFSDMNPNGIVADPRHLLARLPDRRNRHDRDRVHGAHHDPRVPDDRQWRRVPGHLRRPEHAGNVEQRAAQRLDPREHRNAGPSVRGQLHARRRSDVLRPRHLAAGRPGAPLFLSDTGGIAGNTFVNVVTLAPARSRTAGSTASTSRSRSS